MAIRTVTIMRLWLLLRAVATLNLLQFDPIVAKEEEKKSTAQIMLTPEEFSDAVRVGDLPVIEQALSGAAAAPS